MEVEPFIQNIIQLTEVNVLAPNSPYSGFIAPLYNKNYKHGAQEGWRAVYGQIQVLWVVSIPTSKS